MLWKTFSKTPFRTFSKKLYKKNKKKEKITIGVFLVGQIFGQNFWARVGGMIDVFEVAFFFLHFGLEFDTLAV